jgi:hypothetical protein
VTEKPQGATHLENERPSDEEIEEAYVPPIRDRSKSESDDLEEEAGGGN